MNSLTGVQLAGAAAEHGRTLLGETYEVWRIAGILAIVAAVGYEWVTALTRLVSLRLPFLVLYLARLSTPKGEWPYLYKAWKGELHSILDKPKSFWLFRTIKGIAFAVPLALGAARVTAKESPKAVKKVQAAKARRTHRRPRQNATTLAMRAGVAGGTLSTFAVVGAAGSPSFGGAVAMLAASVSVLAVLFFVPFVQVRVKQRVRGRK